MRVESRLLSMTRVVHGHGRFSMHLDSGECRGQQPAQPLSSYVMKGFGKSELSIIRLLFDTPRETTMVVIGPSRGILTTLGYHERPEQNF